MSVKYFAALSFEMFSSRRFGIPKIVVERVVHHHADERSARRSPDPFRSTLLHVVARECSAEKLVNSPDKLVEEHLRELVLLECGVKQQSLKVGIVFVVFERTESERLKHGAIVFTRDAVSRHLCRLKLATRACFVIEDRGIEFFLGREVPENHRLGNARRLCDLFSGSAAKAPIREKTYGNGEDLEAPLFARHSRAAVHAPSTVICLLKFC